MGVVSVNLVRGALSNKTQTTMNLRNVAHPYPKEGTWELLWSIAILPIPHRLQFRKQLSTDKFNFHAALQCSKSLGRCAEHPRDPVVRDSDVIGASTHVHICAPLGLQRIEIPEDLDRAK